MPRLTRSVVLNSLLKPSSLKMINLVIWTRLEKVKLSWNSDQTTMKKTPESPILANQVQKMYQIIRKKAQESPI